MPILVLKPKNTQQTSFQRILTKLKSIFSPQEIIHTDEEVDWGERHEEILANRLKRHIDHRAAEQSAQEREAKRRKRLRRKHRKNKRR